MKIKKYVKILQLIGLVSLALGFTAQVQADPKVTITWQKPDGVNIHEVLITKVSDGETCTIKKTAATSLCSFDGIATGGGRRQLFRFDWAPNVEGGLDWAHPAQVLHVWVGLPSGSLGDEYFHDIPAHNVRVTNGLPYKIKVGVVSSRAAGQSLMQSAPVTFDLHDVKMVAKSSGYFPGNSKVIAMLDGCYSLFAMNETCPGSAAVCSYDTYGNFDTPAGGVQSELICVGGNSGNMLDVTIEDN